MKVKIKNGKNGKLSNNQKIELECKSYINSKDIKFTVVIDVKGLATFPESIDKSDIEEMSKYIKENQEGKELSKVLYNKETGRGVIVATRHDGKVGGYLFKVYEKDGKKMFDVSNSAIEPIIDSTVEEKIMKENNITWENSTVEDYVKAFNAKGYATQE